MKCAFSDLLFLCHKFLGFKCFHFAFQLHNRHRCCWHCCWIYHRSVPYLSEGCLATSRCEPDKYRVPSAVLLYKHGRYTGCLEARSLEKKCQRTKHLSSGHLLSIGHIKYVCEWLKSYCNQLIKFLGIHCWNYLSYWKMFFYTWYCDQWWS